MVEIISLAAAASRLSNTPPEDRFGIVQTGFGPGGITAVQTMQGSEVGYLGVLADYATGRAVQSVLGPDCGIRTAGIRIDAGSHHFQPGDALEAHGEVLDAGRGVVLAAADIRASDGSLAARVSARFIIVPRVDDALRVPRVAGAAAGTLAETLDAQAVEMSAERAVFRAHAADWMSNPFGIVHGGVVVALADLGTTELAKTVDSELWPLALDVALHRPTRLGEDVRVEANVRRVGRRVVTVEVVVSQDRPVAVATAMFARD